jgi:hypothetical protein
MISFKTFILESDQTDNWIDSETLFEWLEERLDLSLDEALDDSLVRKLTKKVKPMGAQPWAQNKFKNYSGGKAKADPALIKKMYDEWYPEIKKRLEVFLSGMKTATKGVQNAKYLVDIKEIDSFLDKTIDRGKNPGAITDFLRGAIIVKDDDDMSKVANGIFKGFKKVVEFEPKERSDNAGNKADENYGAYGWVAFLVDVDGVSTEIQLSTRKSWNVKKHAHRVYSSFRSVKDADLDAKGKAKKSKALAMSRKAFDIGSGRRGGKLDIDGGGKQKKKDPGEKLKKYGL